MKTYDITGRNSYMLPQAMKAGRCSSSIEADTTVHRGSQNKKKSFRWARRLWKSLTGGNK